MVIVLSGVQFALEIARFLGVFGINTATDVSQFIKISREAAAMLIMLIMSLLREKRFGTFSVF